jgi:hypothetical protein
MRVGERDRLDLDQSIGIVEERDAEQRVRDAVEQWRNDIPDRTSSDRFSPTTQIVVLSRSSDPVPASARATCKFSAACSACASRSAGATMRPRPSSGQALAVNRQPLAVEVRSYGTPG